MQISCGIQATCWGKQRNLIIVKIRDVVKTFWFTVTNHLSSAFVTKGLSRPALQPVRVERGPGPRGGARAADVRGRGRRDRLHLQLPPLQGQQEQLCQQGARHAAAVTAAAAARLGTGLSQVCRGRIRQEKYW